MIEDIFRTIDAKDADAFAAHFAAEGRFRFGNLPAVQGRENIRAFVSGFFGSIRALSHRLSEHWEIENGRACHGQVTYTRHDDSTLTVPFAVIYKQGDHGIREYLIFADNSAL